MIPFLILLTVPILLSPFVKDTIINHVRLNKLPLFLFFAILTTLVMLRHRFVGNDTGNYIYYFQLYSHMSWNQLGKHSMEFGFKVINKALSLISKDPQFYLAVTGLAVSAMIYPTYRRACVDVPLTIVLFCSMVTFPMMFSGIRQMLAVGIGCIAHTFVRRKKPIPFLIAVAAAMSIHTSAFMLLPMYPLYHARITKKWLYVVVPVLAAIFVFNRQFFRLLGRFLQSYTDYSVVQTATGAYSILFLFAAFAVFSFVIPDESQLDEETIGMRNYLLLALAIQMFAPLNVMAMRMSYYYIIFIPLLIPRIIQCSSVRYRSIAAAGRNIMLAFFILYFFSTAKAGGRLHTIPYHFFWEQSL